MAKLKIYFGGPAERAPLCSSDKAPEKWGVYPQPRVFLCGDTGVSVEFGDEIDPEINRLVRRLYKRLSTGAFSGIIDMGPAYCSLFIRYDPGVCSLERLLCIIEENLETAGGAGEGFERIVEVPVCYGGEFGPDIGEVANFHGIDEGEVAAFHAAPLYQVYMIGFILGFPYLGGLDSRLYTPRKKEPGNAPAGSIGIADRQSGIYPVASPAGWWIVGMTPLKVFDLLREKPFLFEAGDTVRFRQITREEFESYKNH
ncbi:MAG: 5-oxoprolinase subunit PxpB [Syntrophobacteraceae bacterium]|nr:5-oxoprolinase subunit PxpB [Syntrophobacteraceae bacterium]